VLVMVSPWGCHLTRKQHQSLVRDLSSALAAALTASPQLSYLELII